MVKSLSESEIFIMQLIWDNGGVMSSVELTAALESSLMDWKPTTISTFISRLCKKGLLNSARHGRAYIYTTLLTEEAYRENQTSAFVEKMYNGNAKGLVASLIQNDLLTKEDIAELTRFWNEEKGDSHE